MRLSDTSETYQLRSAPTVPYIRSSTSRRLDPKFHASLHVAVGRFMDSASNAINAKSKLSQCMTGYSQGINKRSLNEVVGMCAADSPEIHSAVRGLSAWVDHSRSHVGQNK
jgi:hypothetical protein